jgi:hypothetical protein
MPAASNKPPLPSQTPQPPLQRLWLAMRRYCGSSTQTVLSRLIPADSNGKPDRAPLANDKRSHPRVPLNDTSVYVTDGCLFAAARIENISPGGICLCNLPEQLYRHNGPLTVYSSDNPGIPVLRIEPRWETTGWAGKTIGAAILNVSDAWRLFFVHAAGRLET